MILTFLGFLYALGMVYAQYPEIMAYNLNLAIFELNLRPAYLALLILLFPYNIQAAEGPKAPPPVLLNEVPTMGFASAATYFTPDGKYMIRIDKNANTVTVYDMSDPKNPELLSTNEYQAKSKAGHE